MSTLHIHIGMPKTGTTAIQDFIALNIDAISEKYNLYYPIRFLREESYYPNQYDFTLSMFKGCFRDNASERRNYERLVTALREELAAIDPAKDVLISSELFTECVEYVACLKRLIADTGRTFDAVKIIVYLRRQDTVLQSFIAQKMKHDSTLDFATIDEAMDFLPTLREGYDGLCRSLTEAFGRENVTVRPYDRKAFPDGDVIADFLHILGIPRSDPDFKSVSKSISNPSMPLELILFRRLLNPILLENKRRKFFLFPEKILINYPSSKKADDLFPPRERLALLERFADGNAAVAREYLGREDGTLFPEKRPDPDTPHQPFPGCTEAELASVFAALVKDAPYRAVWVLGLVERALKSKDTKVRAAAEHLAVILKCQRIPWLLWLPKRMGLKLLGIYKLPVKKQLLQWLMRKPVI